MVTYRKTRSGEWAAFGPVSEVRPGLVTVAKKSGALKTERVKAVSKPFNCDGVPYCYGYLEDARPTARALLERHGRSSYGGGECHTDGNCSSMCSPSTCPCGEGDWFRCC